MRIIRTSVAATGLFAMLVMPVFAADEKPGTIAAPPKAVMPQATGGINTRPIGGIGTPTTPRLPLPTATPIPATTTLSCSDGKSYEVSTGHNGGSCSVQQGANGQNTGAGCDDVGGKTLNLSRASCATGCGTTTGSGTCKQIK